jgi:hydrogenase maturation protease
MGHTLILACGNPLRGDDAVGWEIAEAVQSASPCADIEIETAHQLAPEMAARISQAAIVVFVDASVTHEPGSVRFERIFSSQSAPGTFTHELNPPALLALAAALYGRSPARAFALSVCAESFELNDALSESVRAAIPEAVFTILGYLARQASLPNGVGSIPAVTV